MLYDSNIKNTIESLAKKYVETKSDLSEKQTLRLEDEIILKAEGYVFGNRQKLDSRNTSEDLKQAMRIGILKALRTYDPKKGAFCTWVIHKVRHFISKDKTWQWIKIPDYMVDYVRQYARIVINNTRENIELPTDEELATLLNVSSDLSREIKLAYNLKHISNQFYSGCPTNFDKDIEESNLTIDIEKAISNLKNEDQKYVVEAYYFYQMTLDEIATKLKVSVPRVKKILDDSKLILAKRLEVYK